MDFKYNHEKVEMVISENMEKLGKESVRKYLEECYVGVTLIFNVYI